MSSHRVVLAVLRTPHWSVWATIAAVCGLYGIHAAHDSGRLGPGALQAHVVPALQRVSGTAADLRFRLRGAEPPRHKVVIVDIDSPTLALVGRWPWHRDAIAGLIQALFDAGARVVGLDMVFSEADPRVPEALKDELAAAGLPAAATRHETDPLLAEVIRTHAERLVLGWQSESMCQPALEREADCPVADATYFRSIPASHHAFAAAATFDRRLNARTTPLQSAVTVVANHDLFNAAARHAGYFNAFPDPDGVIRSTHVVALVAGRPHLSLPLAIVQAAKGKPVRLAIDAAGRLRSAAFADEPPLPVDDLGRLRVAWRGPGRTFTYVSAERILNEEPAARAALKDAVAIVGLSALGVHDMRNFPFDSNVPGVEGQATIVDNLLGDGALQPPGATGGPWPIVALMILGGFGFAWIVHRLPARAGVPMALCVAAVTFFVDAKVLLARGTLLDTGLLYVELALLFAGGVAVKYADEEAKKRFLRGAFARYVPPAVVDAIVRDPSQLALGGDKRALTILFSDIRGFTTFSERLDARQLVGFLNHYLGRMTEIVFSHRGTLDKYIGDAVMAFWGAPVHFDDHAARAVAAAIAMHRAVAEIAPVARYSWQIDLEIGVGVASGVVNVGNMGSATNFEYTVIGDRVNLASRLESLTKTYGARILTTADTIDEIARTGGPVPPHRLVDRVRVKGKHDAVPLVEVFVNPPPPSEIEGFNAARALFLQRRFEAAGQAFASLAAASPHRLYPLYVERCQYWHCHPPPEGWAGEWQMDSK